VTCEGGSVTQLEVHDNSLIGSIPSELGSLSNLEYLQLHGNQLVGILPLEVAQLGGRIQASLGSDLCRVAPPGNYDLGVPDTQDYRNADLDGDGFVCSLGFTAGLD